MIQKFTFEYIKDQLIKATPENFKNLYGELKDPFYNE